MNALTLISFDGCPYVQRSVIMLHAKQVPHDVRFIDLKNKPDWFLALNPRGKVPVLVVDNRDVLYESSILNEFLEEIRPDPPMMPTAPIDRARARIWIDQANLTMAAMSRIYFATTPEKLERAHQEFAEGLTMLDHELDQRPATPFFLGERLSLVDATWAPIFDRFPTLEAHWQWSLPPGLKRVAAWAEACLDHPSVRHSHTEGLVERYGAWRLQQLEAFAAIDRDGAP
jgi:glutathione S-transferase